MYICTAHCMVASRFRVCLKMLSDLIPPKDGLRHVKRSKWPILYQEVRTKYRPAVVTMATRADWEDRVPRPKQGKLDVPRHFFTLLSWDREQDKGCSHFFPAHPSLQSHLPQLHWPWPAKRKEDEMKEAEEWNKVEDLYKKNSNKRIEERKTAWSEVGTLRYMCGRQTRDRHARGEKIRGNLVSLEH